MIELLYFIIKLVSMYEMVVFASVIMSWLVAFAVVNPGNPTVRSVMKGLMALTEPLLQPIRRALPDLGSLDISPIVLIMGCEFVKGVLIPNIAKLVL